MIWALQRWFTREWWKYLFTNLPSSTWLGEEGNLERVLCRIKGHPRGEIYFTVYGDEPDHHCKDCGEDLG